MLPAGDECNNVFAWQPNIACRVSGLKKKKKNTYFLGFLKASIKGKWEKYAILLR